MLENLGKDIESHINNEPQVKETGFSAFGLHAVSLRGFDNCQRSSVKLGNQKKLQALVPEMQESQDYNPESAILISENQEPVLAIVNSSHFSVSHPEYVYGNQQPEKVITNDNLSLVNLYKDPVKVIVLGHYTKPLNNNENPKWPGYNYYNHINKAKEGLETLVVQKILEDQFVIFFKSEKGEKVTSESLSLLSEIDRTSYLAWL